jgi:hypothetical protein
VSATVLTTQNHVVQSTNNTETDTKQYNCNTGKVSSETVVKSVAAVHVDTDTTSHSAEQSHTTTTQVYTSSASAQKDYALGMAWNPADFLQQKYVPSAVSADYRAIGNVWLTGQFDWNVHSVLIGIKYEF